MLNITLVFSEDAIAIHPQLRVNFIAVLIHNISYVIFWQGSNNSFLGNNNSLTQPIGKISGFPLHINHILYICIVLHTFCPFLTRSHDLILDLTSCMVSMDLLYYHIQNLLRKWPPVVYKLY